MIMAFSMMTRCQDAALNVYDAALAIKVKYVVAHWYFIDAC